MYYSNVAGSGRFPTEYLPQELYQERSSGYDLDVFDPRLAYYPQASPASEMSQPSTPEVESLTGIPTCLENTHRGDPFSSELGGHGEFDLARENARLDEHIAAILELQGPIRAQASRHNCQPYARPTIAQATPPLTVSPRELMLPNYGLDVSQGMPPTWNQFTSTAMNPLLPPHGPGIQVPQVPQALAVPLSSISMRVAEPAKKKTKRLFTWPVAGRNHDSEVNSPERMASKTIAYEDIYEICECGYPSTSDRLLDRHREFSCTFATKAQGKKKKLLCKYCQGTFSRPDAVTRHMKEHCHVLHPSKSKAH